MSLPVAVQIDHYKQEVIFLLLIIGCDQEVVLTFK